MTTKTKNTLLAIGGILLAWHFLKPKGDGVVGIGGSKVRQSFRKGSVVRLSDSGLDNENYLRFIDGDTKLKITHVAKSHDDHPGFDSSAGDALYDLKIVSTGKDLPFSLYDYELQWF